MSEPADHLDEDEERPWQEPGSFRMDCEPHRGPFLKALGIVAFACGWLSATSWTTGVAGVGLGFAVWLMARKDLKKMTAGLMDPDGTEQTGKARERATSAMILSIIFMTFWLTLLWPLWN